VCDHVLAITMTEADSGALEASTRERLLAELRAQCIRHKEDKLLLRGRIAYAHHARCVLAGRTLAEIERC
jgi:hypothetical protein